LNNGGTRGDTSRTDGRKKNAQSIVPTSGGGKESLMKEGLGRGGVKLLEHTAVSFVLDSNGRDT